MSSADQFSTELRRAIGRPLVALQSLIEQVLIKFHFIVPVQTNDTDSSNTPSPRLQLPAEDEWQPAYQFYIVPILLRELVSPPIHRYLGMGEIILEHRFEFGRYIPPDLFPLILSSMKMVPVARTELEDDQFEDDYYVALACENACWRNALKQYHVLRTDDGLTNVVMWVVMENTTVRVVGVGQLIRHRHILKCLEEYCTTVQKVITNLPGLYQVQENIVCPKCLLEQRSPLKCGVFDWNSLARDRDQSLNFPGLQVRKHCRPVPGYR